MDSNLLYYASAFLLAALSYAALSGRWRRPNPAPLPPGPYGVPILGHLPFLDPNLHSYFARLARSYGPIFSLRLGAKLGVVISSPSLAREVLRDQDAAFANRDIPAAARALAYGGGANIVWNPNGPTWRMLRRACVREMLCPAGLDAVYALRRREVRAAVGSLRERSGTPVEVGTEMFLATMNVVTSTLWGGTLEDREERIAVGKEFRELVAEITELLGRPNVSDFFPTIAKWDLQGIERKMKVLQQRFDGIFDSIIKKKRRSEGDGVKQGGDDFLDFMLRLEKEGGDGKTPFTMTNVKALLMDMVVGGTDTTSNMLEWALAEMIQKPNILRKAQAEVDEVVGKDTIIEESHATKLPYLAMIIKEVLRLHPALPLMVPHCPNSTCVVGGYAVPKDSRVFVNVWAIHRDPEIWEDPLEFRPERFTGGDGGKWDFNGNDFNYIPFGSGRRICAGIAMAERMMMYMLASLLHSFEWQLPEGVVKLDMEERFGIVMKKAQPLVAVPTPRLANDELYL
ncbi:geraniol 8-hydroxylase-like [Canna indica]|uniref:Geraniol 8-hydroxylase-like n=1 Tax=Canna indica TaxID=4628 RepID=A0AAQ3KQH2_9LILI|nr:geraniol 8-hydroxylase-like [Canna indica]